ncbi:hypothetical protein GHT06_018381 [Daphnia sinensis]|uniref:Uncharacterized protein n=1 Tax=Daphnia sinensis TaxID=1820382 RepID=A0AAD5KN48_9CRUS|nr:hypothetical protein GHT06_018381 [Daphnia sinensis]
MLPRVMLPSSIRFYLCMVIFRILAFCDEERPVIYNCEFDRCTLGKSLFQNDKPSLLFFPLSLSLTLFLSLSLFPTPIVLCRVLCSPYFTCFFDNLHDGKPDCSLYKAAPSPPCNYIQVRGQQSPTFHTKTYDALCVL